MRIVFFVLIISILSFPLPLLAQPSPLPPVTGDQATKKTGYFNIIVDPAEYLGAGEEETKDIRLLSLLVAYGLVNGIDWHRVVTENKIKIDERLYSIVRELDLEETVPYDGSFRYSYSYQYIVDDSIRIAGSVEGVGESEKENMAEAWVEARELALIDAVENALARKYTDKQLAIPNEVLGMIQTYEILYDDYNFTDKVYRFKIKAWVSYEPRGNFIDVGPQGSPPER